jgi:ABC-type branched-subunit amino acid transport system substrate-binding protein
MNHSVKISSLFFAFILIGTYSYYVYTHSQTEKMPISITFSEPYSAKEIESLVRIVQNDIDEYLRKIHVTYQFQFRAEYLPFISEISDEEQPYRDPLNITIDIKKSGTRLIVGHQFSPQCKSALNYTNKNGMFMISPYSSDDSLAIANDSLFRLKCVDSYQGSITAKMLKSLGIHQIVIIYLDIQWGNNIRNRLISEYTSTGGDVIDQIGYTSSTNLTDFLGRIEAETQNALSKYSSQETGLVAISIFDLIDIMRMIDNYPALRSITWFGTDAIPSKLSKEVFESEVSEMYADVKIICPSSAPSYSTFYQRVDERFYKETGEHIDFTQAAIYDACWIYTLSVLEAKSTDSAMLKYIIPSVCARYIGVTGNCSLNQFGDRANTNYDIYRFFKDFDGVKLLTCGLYNMTNDMFNWKREMPP